MSGKVDFSSLAVGDVLPQLRKVPDAVQLFRFSAETRNAHRIHYDYEYTKTEGHRERLVQSHLHGAFLAQLVGDWIGMSGRLASLGWSNRSPAFVDEELLCRGRVSAIDPDTRQVSLELEVTNQEAAKCVLGRAIVDFG